MVTPTVEQDAIFTAIRDSQPGTLVAVNAVAGSGKTTTGVLACDHATIDGASGFFCFNKSVAEHLASKLVPSGVPARTFHSAGLAMLRQYGDRMPRCDADKVRRIVGKLLDSDDSWRVVTDDEGDASSAIRRIVDMVRLACLDPHDVDGIYSTADTYGVEIEEPFLALALQALRLSLDQYLKRGTVDFVDMLWIPEAVDLIPRQKLDWLGIDEAQDLSEAQIRLMRRLSSPSTRGIILGDRRQAIQGFAFAAYDSWDQVAAKVPHAGAVELPLSICWRCPTSHLELARRIVPHIQPRPSAPVGTVEHAGLRGVLPWTQARVGQRPMLISRYNRPLIRTCLELIANGVGARIKGREVGQALAKKIVKIERLYAVLDLRGFDVALDRWHADEWRKAEKRRATQQTFDRIDSERDCLRAMIEAVPASTGVRGLLDYCDRIFSDADAQVWLSSVHRAKGLEADHVGIIEADKLGAAHVKPSRRSTFVDYQEDNLEYVALTRSKDTLALFS